MGSRWLVCSYGLTTQFRHKKISVVKGEENRQMVVMNVFNSITGGRGRLISVRSRQTWFIDLVPGQSRLHSNFFVSNKTRKTKQNQPKIDGGDKLFIQSTVC